MRFVWAIAAFFLAAIMIGAGIAQRTVFQGPRTETASISVTEDAPFTMIDGAVLNKLPGAQTLRVQGEGSIFVAYGRTADLEAWLSDTTFNKVTLGKGGAIVTAAAEPTVTPTPDPSATPTPTPSATPTSSASPSATPSASPSLSATPSPSATADAAADATEPPAVAHRAAGSDLWLDEFQEDDLLIAPLELPDTMSVLVAGDGIAAAPSNISVSWPIGNATPWAGPLMVGGGIMLAAGVVLYLLAIRHVRRLRGPRRKGLPLPVTEPIDLAVEGADKGVISAGDPGRKAITTGRRAFAVVPVVAVSALLFSGCTADAWPSLGGAPTPTPSASVIVPENQDPPAVTESQAERIVGHIAETVVAADEAKDPAMAATRLDGAPLAERTTNYTLRGAIADYAALPALLSKPLRIVLPQSVEGWPRSFMAVVDDETEKVSSIMLITQQDPWSDYKLTFTANLEAATELPKLAAVYVGAVLVPPDSAFLAMAPDQLAAAYADVLNKAESSEYFEAFDTDNDQFRAGVIADRQRRLDEFNKTAKQTGTLTFATAPGAQAPLGLQTLESGAIVAVTLNETDTVTPTNADAVIKLPNNPTVKALSGVEQSATGFTTTFSDQIFFYVPGQGSSEKIRLLGYTSNILDAKVIK